MVRISVSELRSLVCNSLRGHGYDEEEVAKISDVLLYAQLRGNNQGVIKLVGTYLVTFEKLLLKIDTHDTQCDFIYIHTSSFLSC